MVPKLRYQFHAQGGTAGRMSGHDDILNRGKSETSLHNQGMLQGNLNQHFGPFSRSWIGKKRCFPPFSGQLRTIWHCGNIYNFFTMTLSTMHMNFKDYSSRIETLYITIQSQSSVKWVVCSPTFYESSHIDCSRAYNRCKLNMACHDDERRVHHAVFNHNRKPVVSWYRIPQPYTSHVISSKQGRSVYPRQNKIMQRQMHLLSVECWCFDVLHHLLE